MSKGRIAIILALVVGLAVIVLWRRHVAAEAEQTAKLRIEALDAIAAVNAKDAEFAQQVARALVDAVVKIKKDPTQATTALGDAAKLLDDYLVTIDRAAELAMNYLEREPEPELGTVLGRLRNRSTTYHSVRDKLTTLQGELRDQSKTTDQAFEALTALSVELVSSQ